MNSKESDFFFRWQLYKLQTKIWMRKYRIFKTIDRGGGRI